MRHTLLVLSIICFTLAAAACAVLAGLAGW